MLSSLVKAKLDHGVTNGMRGMSNICYSGARVMLMYGVIGINWRRKYMACIISVIP